MCFTLDFGRGSFSKDGIMAKVIIRSPKNNQGEVIVEIVKKLPNGEKTTNKVVIPDGEERSFTVDRGQDLRISEK